MKTNTWEECPREDLNMIPQMIAAGWEPEFKWADKRYGRVTPDYAPHDAVKFNKGNLSARILWHYYSGDSYIRVWELETDGHWIIKNDYLILKHLIDEIPTDSLN